MTMAKFTRKSGGGTSFHGITIQTTVKKLIENFPNSYDEGGDKTNYDFTLETEDGDVFTVYDWKHYGGIGMNEVVDFHIGSDNKAVSVKAKAELEKLLA